MANRDNNDYLELPNHLWDVYRTGRNTLFHYPSGADLTPQEQQEITHTWQDLQVRSGNGSWDNEPCEHCQESVCVCHAYPESSFTLPPEEN